MALQQKPIGVFKRLEDKRKPKQKCHWNGFIMKIMMFLLIRASFLHRLDKINWKYHKFCTQCGFKCAIVVVVVPGTQSIFKFRILFVDFAHWKHTKVLFRKRPRDTTMTIELNEQKKTKNTDAKFISKYISGLITRFDDVQRYFPNNSMAIVYHSYELRRATTFSRNTCFCSAVLFATSVKSVRFIGCAFSSNKKKISPFSKLPHQNSEWKKKIHK